MNSNLILHIPHASTWIPEECFPKNGREYPILVREHEKMVDWYTDELFNNGIGVPVIAPVSRMVCDTERFRDDDAEPMSEIGMGVCYSKTHDLKHTIEWGKDHKEWVLKNIYDVHHKYLEMTVDRVLDEFGKALILDCHSFSPVPLPYEPDQNPDRPDICIGTDSFHTPQTITEMTVEFFRGRGLSVKVNTPYLGSIVPIKHYGKNKKVESIMIELNRGLYLKEGTSKKNRNFRSLRDTIYRFEDILTLTIGA